jgi:hypothetical protein
VWPGENGDRDSSTTWLTWAHQDWGIPNTLLAQDKKSHGSNFPQPTVQLGSGIHQAEQASLHHTVVRRLSQIQGLTLNTRCHGLIIADTQGRNDVKWSPRHHVFIWHYLFSSHHGTLTKETNVGRNCPKLALFPGVHISMNLGIRPDSSQRNPADMK